MQLRQAWAKAERLRLDIQYRSYSTGAIRRQDPLIDTIELLIIIDPDSLCQNDTGSESGIAMGIMTHLGLTDVHGRNSANASGLFDGEPVDIYVCTTEELGAMMLFRTGPDSYIQKCSAAAMKYGLLLNCFGLWHQKFAGKHTKAYSEFHICERIGVGWIDPYERRTA